MNKIKMSIVAALAGVLLAGLTGCQKGADAGPSAPTGSTATASPAPAPALSSPAPSPQAEGQIRAAIQEHLNHASNLNLQAFDTDVKKVTIQGDHAEADVDFHIKGGPGVMQLVYQLENRGGTWTVVDSNPVGGDVAHPTGNQNQAPGTFGAPGGNSHSLSDTLRSFKQDGSGAPLDLPAATRP